MKDGVAIQLEPAVPPKNPSEPWPVIGRIKTLNVVQRFSLVSFAFILALGASSGMIMVSMMEQNLIDREAQIIAAFVQAQVRAHLDPVDVDMEWTEEVQMKFGEAFREITKSSDVFHLNVYDRRKTIIWSSITEMIGTVRPDNKDCEKAFGGEALAVLNLEGKRIWPQLKNKSVDFIEIYVPVSFGDAHDVSMVVGTYLRASPLFATIRSTVAAVWATSAVTGLLLYVALFYIFRESYAKEKAIREKAESLNRELSGLNETLEAKVRERAGQIMQMEKLSAMGEVVGELAHQLNNPMVGIVNYAQLASRKAARHEPVLKDLRVIEEAGLECKNMILKLLAFSRDTKLDIGEVDIVELIGECLLAAGANLDGVTVETSYAEGIVSAEVDRILLKQAFQNIIQNAIEAMPSGGRLDISTGSTAYAGTDYAVVTFQDSGPGIPPGNATRIFSPFFTTRKNGTGLGLSIAREIVIKHGGQIIVGNGAGAGAKFSVYVPRRRAGTWK